MSDRRRPQLELALRHLHDIREPSPKAPSMRAEAGFAPGERVPCVRCGGQYVRDKYTRSIVARVNGRGWITDRFKNTVPCHDCGGFVATETVKVRRRTYNAGDLVAGRGWSEYDPMDARNAKVASVEAGAEAPTKEPRTVRCDGCGGSGEGGMHLDPQGNPYRGRCGVCGGSGARVVVAFDLALSREPDAILDHVQRQVDQRTKDLRWVQLERALCDLARHSWAARRLVERVHIVDGITLAELSMPGLEKLELGMRYLLTRLPLDWSAPAGLRANERLLRDRRTRARGRGQEVGRRDKEIREHARAGRSPGWIAAEYGLSVRTVYEVVNGKREESAA